MTGDVTRDKVIDDAAAGWLSVTTTVLVLLTAALLALGCYEAVSRSARSIPLLIVGALFLAAAVRSGAQLATLERRRREFSGHPSRTSLIPGEPDHDGSRADNGR